MRSLLKFVGLVAVFLLPVSGASAQTISNGGFENDIVLGSGYNVAGSGPGAGLWDTTAVLNGWTIERGSVDLVYKVWNQALGLGNFSIDLKGNNSSLPTSTILSQVVNGFTAGVTYALSFDLAAQPGIGTSRVTDRYKRVSVSYFDGVSGGSQTFVSDAQGKTASNIGWVSKSFQFTAGKTGLGKIAFTALDDSALENLAVSSPGVTQCCEGVLLDNISISVVAVPVPIAGAGLPSTMMAAIGFLWFRRRKAPFGMKTRSFF